MRDPNLATWYRESLSVLPEAPADQQEVKYLGPEAGQKMTRASMLKIIVGATLTTGAAACGIYGNSKYSTAWKDNPDSWQSQMVDGDKRGDAWGQLNTFLTTSNDLEAMACLIWAQSHGYHSLEEFENASLDDSQKRQTGLMARITKGHMTSAYKTAKSLTDRNEDSGKSFADKLREGLNEIRKKNVDDIIAQKVEANSFLKELNIIELLVLAKCSHEFLAGTQFSNCDVPTADEKALMMREAHNAYLTVAKEYPEFADTIHHHARELGYRVNNGYTDENLPAHRVDASDLVINPTNTPSNDLVTAETDGGNIAMQ
jgi:hypothetical protein